MSARNVSKEEWHRYDFQPTAKMLSNFVNFYVFRLNPRSRNVESKSKLPTTNTVKSVLKSFYRAYAKATGREIADELKEKTKAVNSGT